MKKILIGFFLIATLTGFAGWRYIKKTPQFSIWKMYQAMSARDYEGVTKYLDVDTVAENLIDTAFKESRSKQTDETNNNSWEELGKNFAAGLIEIMKPNLKEQIKTALKTQIEKGEFKNDYKPQNLFTLFTKTKVKKEGKMADVTLSNQEGKTLSFRLRSKDDYWQISYIDFDLSNLSFSNTEKEVTVQKVTFGNRADIGNDWFLTVNKPIDYKPTNTFEKAKEGYKFVAVETTYENTNPRTNSFSLSNLTLKDEDDHSYSYAWYGKEPQLQSGDLEPGGRVNGYVTFEVLSNQGIKSIVYSGPDKTIVFTE